MKLLVGALVMHLYIPNLIGQFLRKVETLSLGDPVAVLVYDLLNQVDILVLIRLIPLIQISVSVQPFSVCGCPNLAVH